MSLAGPPPSATAGTTRRIRDAVPTDGHAIASIYNEAIERGVGTLDTQPVPAGVYVDQLASGDPRVIYLVAEERTPKGAWEVVGWARIKPWSPRLGYRVAGETSVFVRSVRARRGYGQALSEAALERAALAGYHHVTARVIADHKASVALHRRLGFDEVGVQRRIGHARGRWYDVMIMQYQVPESADDGG